jgi:NADH:ubiquinone oxidoreductase subunit 4 (subunit M)
LWNAAQTNSLLIPGALNSWYAYIAIAAVLVVLITAAWTLRAAYRVYFTEPANPEWQRLPGLDKLEKTAIVFMSGVLIVVGIAPNSVMAVVQSGVQFIVRALSAVGS